MTSPSAGIYRAGRASALARRPCALCSPTYPSCRNHPYAVTEGRSPHPSEASSSRKEAALFHLAVRGREDGLKRIQGTRLLRGAFRGSLKCIVIRGSSSDIRCFDKIFVQHRVADKARIRSNCAQFSTIKTASVHRTTVWSCLRFEAPIIYQPIESSEHRALPVLSIHGPAAS
jgi:hypothetical protein